MSVKQYQPISFNAMPYRCVKPFLIIIGIISFLMSIISYVFCIYVFGGYATGQQARSMMFTAFIAKSVCWAPFCGMEFYDTFFEQIYHDVKF